MMATVCRAVCVLAAALCCTAFCVTAAAAADTAAAPSTGVVAAVSDVSAKETDVSAKKKVVDAASKAGDAAISFKAALRDVQTAQVGAKKAAEDARGILTGGAKEAARLGKQALVKTIAAVTLLKDLVPADSTPSVLEPSQKEEKATEAQKSAKEATELAEWAVTNATKAVMDSDILVKQVETEEQKVKAAMGKAKEAAASIPGEAQKVVAAVEGANKKVTTASAAVDTYIKKLEGKNRAVKDILNGMKTELSAAKKAEELATTAKLSEKKEVIGTEHKALEQARDGMETALKGLETKTEAIFLSTQETENEANEPMALLQAAIKHADKAVELANAEKSTAEAALLQANKELEAAKKKQKEMEKQGQEKPTEEILENEVSERDGEKGLNRPHQPDTTDGTTTPPAGALLPKTDGTADGETPLAQHTDGSSAAWVRALLMLLLACVAV
ncbi:hypothetical protein DQ04_13141010 [Trypanosoma grayi]|uniref:hypothetical protein n=1 Tax=Trypanosoma grayi TaxID=71804 RepID=UPI0004F4B371|nr:hypothetical protein DQ04_13141010 [Trypanosoma grayi]KEG06597.1 hypothetical protein DQ04_13141010 [Trypanosoma grayi]